ncbi:MAG TPA: hypothetical protein VKG25_18735 [Bryobacteraceae bacterium]|nr:hypothetical protein [Bryobacteraceae bacterium]
MSPQLIADVTLYSAADGGKKIDAQPGWGCPCCCSKSSPFVGWDGWPLLDEPLAPGDRRRIGFVFLSGEEAAEIFRKAGTFYLWEGRFIGEAVVVTASGKG